MVVREARSKRKCIYRPENKIFLRFLETVCSHKHTQKGYINGFVYIYFIVKITDMIT
jgi:hypothetical protein